MGTLEQMTFLIRVSSNDSFNLPYLMHSIWLWGGNWSVNISMISTPQNSLTPADLLLSCHANSLLQTLWTCYRFTTCWLAPRCLHCKSHPEPKQTVGLSMHTRIVCSQKLFGIFYSLLSDALNSSYSTWHLTLLYRSLYCNMARLSTPLL